MVEKAKVLALSPQRGPRALNMLRALQADGSRVQARRAPGGRGDVAAVEGGGLEEQRREARLTSYQPLLAVAAQPLVIQPDAGPVTCVAQRARRDNDEHGRLADGGQRVVGGERTQANSYRLPVAGGVHLHFWESPFLVPEPCAPLGRVEQRQLQLHLHLHRRACRWQWMAHERAVCRPWRSGCGTRTMRTAEGAPAGGLTAAEGMTAAEGEAAAERLAAAEGLLAAEGLTAEGVDGGVDGRRCGGATR